MTASVINSDDGLVSGVSGLQTAGGNDGNLDIQSNGVTVAAFTDGAFSVSGNNISAQNSLGFRNRIINGDMRIDQRNAGASVTPASAQYLVDRWRAQMSQSAKFSAQQNAGAVTPPTGFTNYLGVTSLSAYAVTGNDSFSFEQIIEGFNVSDLNWGAASAVPATLSFWVRSSLTGTFGGSLATTRTAIWVMPFTFTISSANTWTYVTVAVTAPTATGGANTANNDGVYVRFGLGSTGTTAGGTAGVWTSAGNYIQPTGTVSVVGTNGATFYITGVQLEAGSVATPFERRPYGTELALCQRYYEKSYSQATAPGTATFVGASVTYSQNYASGTLSGGAMVFYKVSKRAVPTVVTYSTVTGASGKLRDVATTADVNANETNGSENSTFLYGSSATATTVINLQFQWTASAEL